MFQCNELVEMNKFLCRSACTRMTIIDSQLYVIGSLSLDVTLEWNANLVVAWLYVPLEFQAWQNSSQTIRRIYILQRRGLF